MNNFDKRQIVVEELARSPGCPNREIARKLGAKMKVRISEGLVRAVRKELELSDKLQPKERAKGGRRKKVQGESDCLTPLNLTESELAAFLDALRQHVLDLLQQGKVTVAALVGKMSAEQLQGVIGDVEKILPSQPAMTKPQAIPSEGFDEIQNILSVLQRDELTQEEAAILLWGKIQGIH